MASAKHTQQTHPSGPQHKRVMPRTTRAREHTCRAACNGRRGDERVGHRDARRDLQREAIGWQRVRGTRVVPAQQTVAAAATAVQGSRTVCARPARGRHPSRLPCGSHCHCVVERGAHCHLAGGDAQVNVNVGCLRAHETGTAGGQRNGRAREKCFSIQPTLTTSHLRGICFAGLSGAHVS